MTYVRKDLWDLGEGWNDTLYWYAKAIQELQSRPITDNTSWQFLGAIHGFKKDLWISHWQIDKDTPLPSQKDQDTFWNQCQHQSWYFLPWHRGYLQAFENIVRETITKLGGPTDWTLPYWNYNEVGKRPHCVTLPSPFYDAVIPRDGTPNPLALPNLRFGNTKGGRVVINPLKINLRSLHIPVFTGGSTGGTPGFGGPETFFHFEGDVQGGLENNPHNPVHIAVGGHIDRPGETDPFEGLMSDPQMAGLDPVFWLHHANIDRLWQVWLDRNSAHKNPTDPAWVEGPPPGGRPFIMPAPDGSTYTYIVSQMLSLEELGYTYQDLPAPRLLGAQANLAAAKVEANAVADTKVTELLGENAQPLKLLGSRFESPVRLDKPGIAKVAQKLSANNLLAASNAAPLPGEQVYLNVENIRGKLNAVTLSIYVNLPDGAEPEAHPELYAGDIGLFGVRVASQKDEGHAGAGLTGVLDITDIVNRLNANGDLDLDHLRVSLVASTELTPGADISIGRISVYRQGQ